MFSLSIVISLFKHKSEFLLFSKFSWNLSGLKSILLSLNQSRAQSHPDDFKTSTRLFIALAKTEAVLSSAKLQTDTLHRKRPK